MKRTNKKKPVPGPLPVVYGNAIVVDAAGELANQQVERPVRLFENLPGWWARGTQPERTLWLREYFRRALKLTDGQSLVSVVVEVTR